MKAEKPIIQCQVKLRLTVRQERQLEQWLWHLTGVYNWAVKKIEADAKGGIYYSLFDFKALLNGHSKRMGIPWSVLVGTAATAHDAWRRCFRKLCGRPRLKGARNRLNSINFSQKVAVENRRVVLAGIGRLRFHKQDVPAGHIGCARVVRRASGWYACLFIHAASNPVPVVADGEVGIDPGFASLVTLSTGEKVQQASEWARLSSRLAQAQRGRNKRLTARLQERVRNQRKDRNHKLSRRLVAENALVCWSKDPHASIARKFGKSVSSAGHAQLRQQLAYKSSACGRQFIEVPSRNSTRTCSACGALTGPAGWAGLKVRQWGCACGATHERDVNAAVNTLIAGRGMRHENSREAVSGTASRRGVQRRTRR